MNYYYVNGFDIKAENEDEAILKAEERRVARSEMISNHMIFDDDYDDEILGIKWFSKYRRAKLDAYIEFKDIHINVNNLVARGNMLIDFTDMYNKDIKVLREIFIEETIEVEQYTINYLKEHYPNTNYAERYENPTDSYEQLLKSLKEPR